MRSRTVFCSHGFIIPGKPEPWIKFKLKASRFCLACWEPHGEVFLAHGYAQPEQEDPCENGFLDLIHYAITQRGYYRDQDQFEFLEIELRIHLMSKKERIQELVSSTPPEKVKSYVRVTLKHKLQDLQTEAPRNSAFIIERNSERIPDECSARSVLGETREFDISDESQHSALIIDSLNAVSADRGAINRKQVHNQLADHIVDSEYGATRFDGKETPFHKTDDPGDPLSKRKYRTEGRLAKENSQLVREATEEQSHRLDALTCVIKKEKYQTALNAISRLPSDEQKVIQLRFMDGGNFRDGKPRSRREIVGELRNNNGHGLVWSEWDLRRLESQAIIRLRGTPLPASFKERD